MSRGLPPIPSAIAARTAGFASLYFFVDAVLERRRGVRSLFHHVAGCLVSGVSFGLFTRRPGTGFVAGAVVGIVTAPAVWALHDVLGAPTALEFLDTVTKGRAPELRVDSWGRRSLLGASRSDDFSVSGLNGHGHTPQVTAPPPTQQPE